MTPDTTAFWLLAGIVVPRYVRAYRRSHTGRIPPEVLRAYHQSPEWRARKTRYNHHHQKVCVACLWLMPLALLGWLLASAFTFYGWLFAALFRFWAVVLFPLHAPLRWGAKVIRRPFRWVAKVIRRVFRQTTTQLHHITYAGIWDGRTLHPGCEKNRQLGRLCTRLPVVSRLFESVCHHAAADRVRRFAERFGLPPVACFRVWLAKCYVVQIVSLRIIGGLVWATFLHR